MRILDGNAAARQIRDELATRAIARHPRRASGRPPGLGIVLVGDDPASEVYVRHKVKDGTDAGMFVDLVRLPATATLDETLDVVRRLNASPVARRHHRPVAAAAAMGPTAEMTVFETIDPAKDVDGFSPVNVGRLVQNRAVLRSCTPAGVIELLDRSGIEIAGRHAVVIGRSDIVGKPMALMLLHRHATVTICHSRTPDLPAIAARGRHPGRRDRPGRVRHAGLRQAGRHGHRRRHEPRRRSRVGRVVVPGGTRRGAPTSSARARCSSATSIPTSRDIAGAITPVPGGVGPLTRAMLMKNTVIAAEARAVSLIPSC